MYASCAKLLLKAIAVLLLLTVKTAQIQAGEAWLRDMKQIVARRWKEGGSWRHFLEAKILSLQVEGSLKSFASNLYFIYKYREA